jgi:O-antigen biosynthesis protein
MVFGMGTGGPMHEGVGAPVTDPGPAGRWHRARSAVAVTGALMAMRRTVFEHIGGFDTRLSVAFNDVDMCLRSRAAGLRVIQSPVIRAIHYESKTRGANTTCPQVAWDLEELTTLHERWGDALFVDPGYNPHWTRYGRPFDAYRLPGLYEIVRHIDFSGSDGPWRPVPAATESWW